VLALGVLVPLAAASVAGAAVGSTTSSSTLRHMHRATTTTFRANASGGGSLSSNELGPDLEGAGDPATTAGRSGHPPVRNRSLSSRFRSKTPPIPASPAVDLPVTAPTIRLGPQIDGLNAFDQRTANGGNQFTVEPPDQALCVGGGHVVEAVNDVARVWNTSGSPETGVMDLNTLLGYPAQFNRSTGEQGPFVTDPTCHYDAATGTFFLVTLTLEVDSVGNFTGGNTLDVATTTNPRGVWNVYHLQVRDDGKGGTPSHPGCPCIGDYPHIGADANGFYITTNEYPFFADGFVAAQIYAFPKAQLASGAATVNVVQFDTSGRDAGNPGFTVWPALSPDAQFDTSNNGTEYLLSSNAAEEANAGSYIVSDTIVTWALTGTATLTSATPALTLSNTRVPVPVYSLPPLATQKAGPVPLADCLNLTACAKFLLGHPNRYKEYEGRLDSGDTRMQQVTYAAGKLYGALDTAVALPGGTRAGIAYYVLTPTATSSSVGAALTSTETFGVAGNDVTYPAIGVTGAGKGVMTFTLTGTDYYPSQAFTTFTAAVPAAAVHVARLGAGPTDGFSEYRAFGDPPRPRWGDYGATAVVGDDVWLASEDIAQSCTLAEYVASSPFGRCGDTRVALANWSTSIAMVTP